jgi:hypothetical protein
MLEQIIDHLTEEQLISYFAYANLVFTILAAITIRWTTRI